ncbi:UNVERIFIED_CONTAM: hypothetical protein H355_005373 [Colinus virginianus]|nr:hypothetical protein H355_005373 [Colinus virginianus]
MMALALVCAYNRTELQDVRNLLKTTLSKVANGFLNKQTQGKGIIGNVYSTGLAMQLLLAASEFYAPRVWDCTQPVAAITARHLQQPMAIAQALPALVGRTYLDSASLHCSTEAPTTTGPQVDPAPSQASTAQEVGPYITVTYTITNHLRGEKFTYTITVSVPAGSVLLDVLKAAEKADPTNFSFETKTTFWGPMVVSIHGLAGSEADRTYWQFFSGQEALDEGPGGSAVPRAGLKKFALPPDYSGVAIPERPKLKFMEKVPAVPKARREPRQLRDIRGPSRVATEFTQGQFGILALGGGYLHWGHLEMIRLTVARCMDPKNMFAIWRVPAPYKPLTKKSLGHRMGGGKGPIDRYVTAVKSGRLVVELGGRCEFEEVKPFLTQVARKLPFPAVAVSRQSLQQMREEEEEKRRNNQNPWTFERVVTGNMLGMRSTVGWSVRDLFIGEKGRGVGVGTSGEQRCGGMAAGELRG